MKLILTNEDVKCAIMNYVKEKVILPDNAKITVTKDTAIVEWSYEVISNKVLTPRPIQTPTQRSYGSSTYCADGIYDKL